MLKKNSTLEGIFTYGKIILGSAIYAVSFQYITYPNAIVSGGLSGIAMIVNYLTGFPVGILTILLSIPLFVISWRHFGISFLVASLVGLLASSLLVDLLSLFPLVITSEVLLASVYGGLIKGFGLGLVLSTGASTGGMDIAAKLIRKKRPDFNYGTILLMIDAAVIAAFALIFKKFDSAMYAIISMYIGTKVIDLVLTGALNSKICYVISDKSKELKDAIYLQLRRGVTMLHGTGAYSQQEKNVILCVIKRAQIVVLKQIVGEIDPNAFMIVSDSTEVFGTGFGSIYE